MASISSLTSTAALRAMVSPAVRLELVVALTTASRLSTLVEEFNDTEHDMSAIDLNINGTDADGVIALQPGELRAIDVAVTTAPNSSLTAYLDFKADANSSASFTIYHVEVTSAGTNVGCMVGNSNEEFVTSYNSSHGTTQMDYAIFQLGIVTNSGATFRKGTYEAEDDKFTVTVQIKMADALENTDGSNHSLSIGLSIGNVVAVLQKDITVMRTFTELPDIVLEAELNATHAFTSDDEIMISALLSHTNESQAEGYNTTASFYFPPFMRFVGVVSTNLTMTDILNATGDAAGVAFVFETLYFTDLVSFTFRIQVISDYDVPFLETEVNGTTPYEAGSHIIARDGHVNVSGEWFVARVDRLAYEIVGPDNEDCSDVPLGMQDAGIANCQIASSLSADDTTATNARLGSATGWSVGLRAGSFAPYLQVYFGNKTTVVAVTINSTGSCHATDIGIAYSDDGVIWETLPTTLALIGGNERVELPYSLRARYMQVQVLEDNCAGHVPQIRAELHGCFTPGHVPLEEVCSRATNPWSHYANLTDVYTRGILATTEHLYYCDEIPREGGARRCFRSTVADPDTWITIDETVVSILGYDSDKQELHAISWDKRSFLLSSDGGATWSSVSSRRHREAESLVPSTEIPWTQSANFKPGVATGTYVYSSGNLGAMYDGLYYGDDAKVTWDTCCN